MIYDGRYGRCDENSRQDLDIKSLTGFTERTEKSENFVISAVSARGKENRKFEGPPSVRCPKSSRQWAVNNRMTIE